jgi:hypothetical protein
MEEHIMNTDPLLVGVGSIFPNQNSSTAPTVWEEDTDQGAQQGLPSGSGPMLTLTKRSSNLPFLPGGAVNPAQETNPQCLIVTNLRISPGAVEQLSSGRLASGLVGAASIGGTLGARGIGVLGVGAPGDGVRGLAAGARPAGHGVFGSTGSANTNDAGVCGVVTTGARGVLGRHIGFPPGSGLLNSVTQAVRGEGGIIGVCGEGRTVNPNGTPATSGWGVVGKGVTAGVQGGDGRSGGIGVIGVSGPGVVIGGLTFFPLAGRFDGPVRIRHIAGVPGTGTLTVDGSLFVSGPTKASVVPHPDGSQRVLHSVEAPERWFEDIGRAQLREGVARVDVDPDFAAVSGLGDDYHVFLTAEGPSNGLYVVNRTSTGFEVREQGQATSEIMFSYRIMTKHRNAGTGRLEPIELPSEAGVRTTEPAEAAAVPSPAFPEEPAPAEPLPEGAVPAPPSDWPESVPWPPDIMRNWNSEGSTFDPE